MDFNPRNIKTAAITLTGGTTGTETVITAKRARLIGVTARGNGSALGGGSCLLRDASTIGGGAAAAFTVSLPVPAVAGQGPAWPESAYGQLFRNGITAQILNSNAAVEFALNIVYEEQGGN